MEQEFIEISSDEESESKDKVKRENNTSIHLKKRTLSNSASASGPPSKQRITHDTVDTIKILDLDDEHPIVSMKAATNAGTVTSTRPVKVESRADSEKMALCNYQKG